MHEKWLRSNFTGGPLQKLFHAVCILNRNEMELKMKNRFHLNTVSVSVLAMVIDREFCCAKPLCLVRGNRIICDA